jgi:glycosyltransferase involved in cell wall biosynthesis
MIDEISICVPTYNNTAGLLRLLKSIEIQSYKSFEVVISDDSTSDEIKHLVETFKPKFELKYFKNNLPLGTPLNWNNAIEKATYQIIKIMHHDDWFANEDSLLKLLVCFKQSPSKFAFSYSRNINLQNNKLGYLNCPNHEALEKLKKDPFIIFKENIIGAPSAVIFERDNKLVFNKNLKWFVDCKFYFDFLQIKKNPPGILRSEEINIGISPSQVTNSCNTAEIILGELIYCLDNNDLIWKNNKQMIILIFNQLKRFQISNINDFCKQVRILPCKEIEFLIKLQPRMHHLGNNRIIEKLLLVFYFIRFPKLIYTKK